MEAALLLKHWCYLLDYMVLHLREEWLSAEIQIVLFM
jgi:hypothetical protein